MRLKHVGFCLAFVPGLFALCLPFWSRTTTVEPQAVLQAATIAADYTACDVLGARTGRFEKDRERTDLDQERCFLGKLLVALQTADSTSTHPSLHAADGEPGRSRFVAPATLQLAGVRWQV